MKNKYTGSYIVIGLGVLYWIGSAFSIVKDSTIGPILGSSMILGGLAYKSGSSAESVGSRRFW